MATCLLFSSPEGEGFQPSPHETIKYFLRFFHKLLPHPSTRLTRLGDDDHHQFIVIATARNAAGSNPEDLKGMINMDCFAALAMTIRASSLSFSKEDNFVIPAQAGISFRIER
jgi:hypothetical protein